MALHSPVSFLEGERGGRPWRCAPPVLFGTGWMGKAEGAAGPPPRQGRRPVKEAEPAYRLALADLLAQPMPVPPRANGCGRFVRRQLALWLPLICRDLLREAADGNAAALKMLLVLTEMDGAEDGKDRIGGGLTKHVEQVRAALAEFRNSAGHGPAAGPRGGRGAGLVPEAGTATETVPQAAAARTKV
jgi:hypothetical protein